jgi:hypothetical protein
MLQGCTIGNMFDTLASGNTVKWLSESRFAYFEDDDKYVLLFVLCNKDQVSVRSSGTVKIRIVNDDGITVYDMEHAFTESNFSHELYHGTEVYPACIFIDPNDITPGSSSTGTIYFSIYGNDYAIGESALFAYNLPLAPIHVTIDDLPKKVTYYSYNGSVCTTTRIDSITYEVQYDDSLYIYFTGEKTFDHDGNHATNACEFKWKLYDSEGYLLDSGTIMVFGLIVGDKFKDKQAIVFDGIEPGGSYKIVITDYQ